MAVITLSNDAGGGITAGARHDRGNNNLLLSSDISMPSYVLCEHSLFPMKPKSCQTHPAGKPNTNLTLTIYFFANLRLSKINVALTAK